MAVGLVLISIAACAPPAAGDSGSELHCWVKAGHEAILLLRSTRALLKVPARRIAAVASCVCKQEHHRNVDGRELIAQSFPKILADVWILDSLLQWAFVYQRWKL